MKDIQPIDKERNIISLLMRNLGNAYPDPDFETDACPFRIGDEKLLFSTDEFSVEDNFRSHDAYTLGWNMTAATMSDILAAGGVPMFYGHSVTIQVGWDNSYLDKFSKGIAGCLEVAGARFLGGDLGMSDKWCYTGIAIGRQLVSLNRRGAKEGDIIFMTGQVGAGNLEAALKLYSDKKSLKPILNKVNVTFPLRLNEASLVRKFANSCIDSSDGLLRALLDLSRISQKGFRINNIPYDQQGLIACKFLGKPEELLFMGECGEYELVFTVSPEREYELLSEARSGNIAIKKLGFITDDEKMILQQGKKTIDLTGYNLFARNYKDVKEYIDELVQFIINETK